MIYRLAFILLLLVNYCSTSTTDESGILKEKVIDKLLGEKIPTVSSISPFLCFCVYLSHILFVFLSLCISVSLTLCRCPYFHAFRSELPLKPVTNSTTSGWTRPYPPSWQPLLKKSRSFVWYNPS